MSTEDEEVQETESKLRAVATAAHVLADAYHENGGKVGSKNIKFLTAHKIYNHAFMGEGRERRVS